MPHASKRVRAARAREAAKRLIRQSLQPAFILPELVEVKSELEYNPALSFEGESSFPFYAPTIEVDIKLEPDLADTESPILLEYEVEVKDEPLDLENSDPVTAELDPIEKQNIPEQNECPILLQSAENEENADEYRCQFCLKLFGERGGRGMIMKAKIEFVLGLTQWGTPGRSPDCCEECRKMFDMFHEFKQACLVALARPAEMFVWAGKMQDTGSTSKPALAKSTPTPVRPKLTMTGQIAEANVVRKSQVPSSSSGLGISSEQESLQSEIVSTEALSTQLRRPAEDIIFNEKLLNGYNMLNHNSTASNETDMRTEEPLQKEEKAYCFRCNKFLPNKEALEQHKPACIEADKRNKPVLQCSLCPMTFSLMKNLEKHIGNHNGLPTLPCRQEGCTKVYSNPKNRKNHESSCGQETSAICTICKSIFQSKSALNHHLTTHGDPKFKCEICNKAFYAKTALKKHASAHSDERQFQCKVCGKRFKSHEANRVHQRIHTEEKPYICHVCGQGFRYNCVLKTHLIKRHNAVPELLAKNVEVFRPESFLEWSFNGSKNAE